MVCFLLAEACTLTFLNDPAAVVSPSFTGLLGFLFSHGQWQDGRQPSPRDGSETNASDGHHERDSELPLPLVVNFVLGSSSPHMAPEEVPGQCWEVLRKCRYCRTRCPAPCSQGSCPPRGLLSPSHKQLSARLAPSPSGTSIQTCPDLLRSA